MTFEKLLIYYGAKGLKLNPATYQRNLGLLTEDGRYSLLAQLLSDNSHIPFRVAIFSGKTKADNFREYTETIGGGCTMNEREMQDVVNGILSALPGNIVRIVLYGSVARGTATDESDVDIAVFVTDALSAVQLDQLSDAVVELNLKYDKVYSVIDIPCVEYEKWRSTIPFYKNVSDEGVVLWTAA